MYDGFKTGAQTRDGIIGGLPFKKMIHQGSTVSSFSPSLDFGHDYKIYQGAIV